MTNRLAVMGIIVDNPAAVERLNALLHDHRDLIVGRMGIPYRARGVNVISLFLDAPQDALSALAGRIGGLPGVTVKTVVSSAQFPNRP